MQKIDDIIALIALYRPGPMDLIGDYIKRKKGLTKIRYEHPLLEEICADTYGVMIYQEQVMAAASKLAGYSLSARRSASARDGQKGPRENGEGARRTSSKVARGRTRSRRKRRTRFSICWKNSPATDSTRATARPTA